jgi:hypothetical protein
MDHKRYDRTFSGGLRNRDMTPSDDKNSPNLSVNSVFPDVSIPFIPIMTGFTYLPSITRFRMNSNMFSIFCNLFYPVRNGCPVDRFSFYRKMQKAVFFVHRLDPVEVPVDVFQQYRHLAQNVLLF